MIYTRGHRADYDEWAALGLAGWGYEDVLPYFKRAEDNERGESHYHGAGGPLSVSDSRSRHPLVETAIAAAVEAGLEPNDDFNGAGQEGTGRYQFTQRDGRRCSAAVAYLHPAVERGNVELITDAPATRILFDGRRAVGVEILRGGRLERVAAEGEVILSAGAYGSPQLLLLSGIGPADELKALGLEPREDLPVGRNLQDHLMLVADWLTTEKSLLGAMTPANVALFEREGRGPLTSNAGEGGGFVRTRSGLEAPDVQYIFAAMMTYEELLGVPTDDAVALATLLLKPTSRGQLTLRSTLPHAKPRILHNYLTTEEDCRSMVDGVRLALEIAAQPTLAKVLRGPAHAPASDSDTDILDFVRREAHTVYHPVASCALGAVVDGECRVYGVERLRVVDASVMPIVPRANTNAPTIMVAEKVSDAIRGLPALSPIAADPFQAGSSEGNVQDPSRTAARGR
jgi:choline dehydrogenase-like flavoprotein